jgi:transposase
VLCVETIGKIRRRRLVQGESISAIARDLRLSRNTVKRALRVEGEALEYRRTRQPQPKLGPYRATLDAWLEAEQKLPAREQRTAQRMYEALCLEGYTGAVDGVRRHMRAFERARRPVATAFIPQSFAPGEAYQFDWSHEHVVLGGVEQVVKVGHLRLCHSRAFFLVAYPRESQEMVFDAHARAFTFLGGVPRRGIYDNLKPAVDAIFTGRERRYNRRFLAMCNHYLIEPTACTPASGWEKGQVENQVGNVREWVFTPKLHFADLAELNVYLADRSLQLARERAHPEETERRVAELWDEERMALRAMPAPFDGYAEKSARISATCLVHFERNRYSVECRYVGQVASVHAYAERIVVVCGGQIVGEHPRCFERGRTLYNPWHYVAALERKPGALRNGAPFKDWNLPAAMTRLRERTGAPQRWRSAVRRYPVHGRALRAGGRHRSLRRRPRRAARQQRVCREPAAPGRGASPAARPAGPRGVEAHDRACGQLRSLRPTAATACGREPRAHPITGGSVCKSH